MLDEIIEIIEIGEEETIDIEVDGNHLFFANDMLVHNSALEADHVHQGHIQGGISKVNTAGNFIAIVQTEQMRAAGEYWFEYAKTRNSNGVGKKTLLRWDPIALRITSNENQKPLNISKDSKRQANQYAMNSHGTVFDKINKKNRDSGLSGVFEMVNGDM